MPKRQLLKLFFDERYGERVVIPSMTPVAAWVALDDQDVLRELLARDPEILVLHADAASLPLNARGILGQFAVGVQCRALRSRNSGHARLSARKAVADTDCDIGPAVWQTNVEPQAARLGRTTL